MLVVIEAALAIAVAAVSEFLHLLPDIEPEASIEICKHDGVCAEVNTF